jgi:hypothetical protein
MGLQTVQILNAIRKLKGIQVHAIMRPFLKRQTMALQGQAALAMWWDMAADRLADFEHWHTHEHFPERLAIPGFLRAARWRDAGGGEGIFVMYELASHDVLSSPAYAASLNTPTPWSVRMMPHHRNMVRSQCRVLESHGGAIGRHALTLRLSPRAGSDGAQLRAALAPLVSALPLRSGLGGAHLLQHRAPAMAATTEQKIRGADAFADWVLVVTGYDLATLQTLAQAELSDAALVAMGAAPGSIAGFHQLSFSAVPADIA